MEPFKGSGVFADPDELHTTKTSWRVRSVAHVPDIFEDGSPWGNTDSSSDEDGNFVVKHVFGGRTVGTVNSESGHLLAVLEDFVHSHGVHAIVEFGLCGSGSEGVTEGTGEISYFTDVD